MDEGDLQAFVDRAREALDRSPGMSARTTDLRIVLPLLEALGWGIHGPGVCPDYAVEADGDRVEVDYALLVDVDGDGNGDPAAFVVTVAAGGDVDGAVRRLGTATTAAGVDLGLATNGREYVLLGRRGDRVERARLDLSDLAADPAPLAHYTRAATERRRRHHRRERRREAGQHLAGDRDAVVASVTDALAGEERPDLDGELATAGEAFVDRVLDALAAGDHPGSAVAGHAHDDGGSGRSTDPGEREESRDSGPDPAPTPGPEAAGDPDAGSNAGLEAEGSRRETQTGSDTGPPVGGDGRATSDDADGGSPNDADGGSPNDADGGSPDDAGERSRATPDGETGDPAGSDDSEFVVRFFNDRTSVGAVGHATAAGATAQAVEFLIEQYGLDSRLQLPWGPDDADGRAILAREPVHPDGTGMSDATQLSNGYHLYADLPAAADRRVVETLAGKAGLRVMFQGEWADG